MTDALSSHSTASEAPVSNRALRLSLRRRLLQADLIGGVVSACDVIVILGASQVAYVGYSRLVGDLAHDALHYLGIALISAGLIVLWIHARGGYSCDRLPRLAQQLKLVAAVHIGTFALLAVTAFALKIGSSFSRAGIFAFELSSLSGLLINHGFWNLRIHQSRREARDLIAPRRVLVVASVTELSGPAVVLLRRNGFDPVQTVLLPDGLAPGTTGQAQLQHLSMLVKQCQLEEIVLLADWPQVSQMAALAQQLRALPLAISVVIEPSTSDVSCQPMRRVGDLVTFEMQRPPLSLPAMLVKRGLDVLLAGLGLFLLSPLLLLVALVIRLDSPGPVIFRQTRLGFNGIPFKILKFRSMRMTAEGDQAVQAHPNDDRVTRSGAFLRRTSIDELPQLWNILRGDMALVGPRPHLVAHDAYYEQHLSGYALRQHFKPGLTGWAQVNGSRGETPTLDSMARRVALDMWYATHYSLALDLKILAMTLIQLVSNRHVY